jgi:hypothetical protein
MLMPAKMYAGQDASWAINVGTSIHTAAFLHMLPVTKSKNDCISAVPSLKMFSGERQQQFGAWRRRLGDLTAAGQHTVPPCSMLVTLDWPPGHRTLLNVKVMQATDFQGTAEVVQAV